MIVFCRRLDSGASGMAARSFLTPGPDGGQHEKQAHLCLFLTLPSWLNRRPMFELLKNDTSTSARLGRLTTARGAIDTPVFMPVGTQGSVKALDPRELDE